MSITNEDLEMAMFILPGSDNPGDEGMTDSEKRIIRWCAFLLCGLLIVAVLVMGWRCGA